MVYFIFRVGKPWGLEYLRKQGVVVDIVANCRENFRLNINRKRRLITFLTEKQTERLD